MENRQGRLSQVKNNGNMASRLPFFDFYSDSSVLSTRSYDSTIESEFRAMKFRIVDEIERRKTAEESIVLMRSQWERIGNIMSQAGLTFPTPPAGDNMLLGDDSINQLLQEVVVSQFVSESIGSHEAHAEAEEAAAKIIESKDHEITRLRDRLHYYETVTHEMSQRKLVEVAVRQQRRKKHWRRWMWGLIGFTVSAGASYVAYSYVPSKSRFLSSMETGDSIDRHP